MFYSRIVLHTVFRHSPEYLNDIWNTLNTLAVLDCDCQEDSHWFLYGWPLGKKFKLSYLSQEQTYRSSTTSYAYKEEIFLYIQASFKNGYRSVSLFLAEILRFNFFCTKITRVSHLQWPFFCLWHNFGSGSMAGDHMTCLEITWPFHSHLWLSAIKVITD